MTLHNASTLIKGEARQSLLGHLPVAVGANLIYLILSVLLSTLAADAAPGSGWIYLLTANVFLYVVDLAVGILDYGLCYIYMSLQYHQTPALADLLRGFQENTETIVRVQAVLSAISVVISLPSSILSYVYEEPADHLAVMIPVYVLTIVAALAVDLLYALVWYILLDYPDLTWREALRSSRRLMRGNKRVLCYIVLSLTPLYLVSILSLGISALWVLAYQHAAVAAFYRGLVNARKR